MTIGQNISEIRREKGLTQAELAKLVGVSYPRISDIENGVGNPRIKTVQKIANALKTTISDLTAETVSK